MSSQHLCPFCGFPLLCQVVDGVLSWYCRHCHLEIPYGICDEISEEERYNNSIAENKTLSTMEILEKIWENPIEELKESLEADRVILWKYNEQGELKVLVEALNPDYPSMKDWMVGHLLTKKELGDLTAGKLEINSHVVEAKENFLESFFEVKSKLVAPIILSENHQMSKLWGLLLVNYCAQPHQWQTIEINLLSIIAKQIGLSVKQIEENQRLQQEYKQMEFATCKAPVTGLKSFCQLESYLEQQWQEILKLAYPISVIVCGINSLAKYQHIFGEQAKVNCLKQIAKIISNNCTNKKGLAVKNTEDELVIVLPSTDGSAAVKLAEKIRREIKDLHIIAGKHDPNDYLTVSLGVASIVKFQ